MDVLLAGPGWLGREIAIRLAARGDRVVAVRRSDAPIPELAAAGVRVVAADLRSTADLDLLPRRLHAIVACQAASERSEDGYRDAYVRVNRVLAELARRTGARGPVYTGSTGIFNRDDGSTVDEATDPAPRTERAVTLAEGEAIVREVGCVVRLSGLYGPGRFGTVDRVRRGSLALGPGDDAWMNFCQRDDAATAVVAALDRGRQGAVYHGTDAHPPRRADVVRYLAARLGIDPPRTEAPSPRGTGRRVLGERTRAELGFALAYPSFREGFEAAFTGSGGTSPGP